MQSQSSNGAPGAAFNRTRGNQSSDGRLPGSTSIGELVGQMAGGRRGPKPVGTRRTGQPVRRHSYYAHDKRSTALWRPLGDNRSARRLIGARLKAAEWYNERNKQPGDRQGPIGDVGLRLLRELYRIVDFKTGRLEPAIDTLCERVKRARSTVVKYLAKLKEHGFLDWVRRSEPTVNEGQAGPQIRQISNAYGFSLPRTAAAWVAKILGGGPTPDDELARREEDRRQVEAMLDQAGTDEVVDFVAGNEGELSEILKRIGHSLSKNSASLNNGHNSGSGE